MTGVLSEIFSGSMETDEVLFPYIVRVILSDSVVCSIEPTVHWSIFLFRPFFSQMKKIMVPPQKTPVLPSLCRDTMSSRLGKVFSPRIKKIPGVGGMVAP